MSSVSSETKAEERKLALQKVERAKATLMRRQQQQQQQQQSLLEEEEVKERKDPGLMYTIDDGIETYTVKIKKNGENGRHFIVNHVSASSNKLRSKSFGGKKKKRRKTKKRMKKKIRKRGYGGKSSKRKSRRKGGHHLLGGGI